MVENFIFFIGFEFGTRRVRRWGFVSVLEIITDIVVVVGVGLKMISDVSGVF